MKSKFVLKELCESLFYFSTENGLCNPLKKNLQFEIYCKGKGYSFREIQKLHPTRRCKFECKCPLPTCKVLLCDDCSRRLANIMAKGEIVHYKQFLLFLFSIWFNNCLCSIIEMFFATDLLYVGNKWWPVMLREYCHQQRPR